MKTLYMAAMQKKYTFDEIWGPGMNLYHHKSKKKKNSNWMYDTSLHVIYYKAIERRKSKK